MCTYRFWIRVLAYAPTQTTFHARFQRAFEQYALALVEQSRGRGPEHHPLSITEYIQLRQMTAGSDPLRTIAEIGLELPHEVLEHPLVESLHRDIRDILNLINVRASIYALMVTFLMISLRTCFRTTRNKRLVTITMF